MKHLVLLTSLSLATFANATPQVQVFGSWRVDNRGAGGVLVQTGLPNSLQGKRRTVFLAFEYERMCDPIFSFAEFSGNKIGQTLSKSLLKNSKIGINLNKKFYTWHAGIVKYNNGYEAGFGVTNNLFLQMITNLSSLEYITPTGEIVNLPTSGFREATLRAVDICRDKVMP